MIGKTRFLWACLAYFILSTWTCIALTRFMVPFIQGSIDASFAVRTFLVPIPVAALLSLAIAPVALRFFDRRDFDFPGKAARVVFGLAGVGLVFTFVMLMMVAHNDLIYNILISANILSAVVLAGFLLRFLLIRLVRRNMPDVDPNLLTMELTSRVVFIVLIGLNVLLIFMNGQHLISLRAYEAKAVDTLALTAQDIAQDLSPDLARAEGQLRARLGETGQIAHRAALLGPEGRAATAGGVGQAAMTQLRQAVDQGFLTIGDDLWVVIKGPAPGTHLAAAMPLARVHALIYKDMTRPLIILALLGLAFAAVTWWLLRTTLRPIDEAIAGLAEVGRQVAGHAHSLHEASQRQAEGASQQAASLEETSASLEQMAAMTRQNAQHSSKADEITRQAIGRMDSADRSMADLNDSMGEITKASERTFQIIRTIDEIAFQTNLLALNAAVEAARAGESGAGFAVVADEVRSLALRSAEAAGSTTQMIEGTVSGIKHGTGLVSETAASFHDLLEEVREVGGLVADITGASHEQAQGIDQINKAMSQMDQATQSGAAQAEESAAAAAELNHQAAEMRTLLGRLLALTKGGAGA